MPRGDRTRVMASEVPLMYGIVAEVVTLGKLPKRLVFQRKSLVGDFRKKNPE